MDFCAMILTFWESNRTFAQKKLEFINWINKIAANFKAPLPGLDAQVKMSSIKRFNELVNPNQSHREIPSSVLLLFYPVHNIPYLVFIQRPQYDGVHAGQIGLPGGRVETEDQDLQATALRECREEIGVDPDKISIIGTLSDLYIPPSQFLVTPFVGYTTSHPSFVKDPVEVDEIIELPINKIFQDGSIQQRTHKAANGLSIKAPAYVVEGKVIWGATAMILSELNEVINQQ
jgi:8-oxo-dGTP pyrophosphatase MutT (NUDIX family)